MATWISASPGDCHMGSRNEQIVYHGVLAAHSQYHKKS
jgi:hypothetical protein